MGIINNYDVIIKYLNCLPKATTSLRVSSGSQRQAAANFDVCPNSVNRLQLKLPSIWDIVCVPRWWCVQLTCLYLRSELDLFTGSVPQALQPKSNPLPIYGRAFISILMVGVNEGECAIGATLSLFIFDYRWHLCCFLHSSPKYLYQRRLVIIIIKSCWVLSSMQVK